ncbi:MAG: hypothetical protein AB7F59_00075 [Bdellovibrionales bacterium]
MLEWQTSGQDKDLWIPLWNGALLHSQKNPQREANLWLEQQKNLLEGVHTAFVLGLAGGFHIQALQEYNPQLKIVVIESHEAFVTLASPLVRSLQSRALVFTQIDPHMLLKNKNIEEDLKRTFCVLEYRQATKLDPDYYRHVKAALCGRDWKSFNHHVKLRGQGWMNQYNFIEKSDSLISIKPIADEIQNQKIVTPEMMQWLCIRELVK